jgi:hypothetical protein
MADIQKFLDRAGTSTLWSKVATELNKKATVAQVEAANAAAEAADAKAVAAGTAAAAAQSTADQALAKAGTNETAIELLNSEAGVEGSIAYKITQMVLVEDENGAVDKLKEIAAWIADHPDDAAGYNQRIAANAAAITALQTALGDIDVSGDIAEAIEEALYVEGVEKYALASAVAGIAQRLETAEGNITTLQGKVQTNTQDISTLKDRVDGIASVGGEANLINEIKVNGTVQAPVDKVVDITIPVVQALSPEEIDAAIAEAVVQVQ